MYLDLIKSGKVVSQEKYDLSSLALLRCRLGEDSGNVANMAEGLENRIDEAIKTSICLNEIYDRTKTKRYTHSRIRRAVLCRQFDIKKDHLNIAVPYCRLLGFNKSCENTFGKLAGMCSLPFITRYSDFMKMSDNNMEIIFNYEDKSTDFYNLILSKSDVCSNEKIYSPVKI